MQIDKKYILLAVLFTSLILFEYFAPKEPDWSYSFSQNDKDPFGGYIIYNLLEDAFPAKEILTNKKSLYNFKEPGQKANYSYIINTDNFVIDELNKNRLLSIANRGVNILISAMTFEKLLCDTLQFKTEILYSNSFSTDSMPVRFNEPSLKSENGYYIQKAMVNYHFSEFDSTTTNILGTMGDEWVNFIKVPFGKGAFYLHSQPIAFTNYNMLTNNNAEYAFKILSYLDNNYIVWDEKHKPGNTSAPSPLGYILKHKALRSAYYLILGLVVLFFFFNGKRKQRPIPIIVPQENSSLEFAATLSSLYLNNKNHRDILLKRYLYWTDFIREKYYISIEQLAEKAPEIIAKKTGAKIACINKILKLYREAKQQKNISQDQLLTFNKLIEQFYKERN
ncbi:MAG: hypothetical protein DRJ10_16460 [Bacteroidetes bacterium]|nr:MAG: hypothetical protein DRJ10_16460 [Bacteroidota bacterium]